MFQTFQLTHINHTYNLFVDNKIKINNNLHIWRIPTSDKPLSTYILDTHPIRFPIDLSSRHKCSYENLIKINSYAHIFHTEFHLQAK